MQLFLLAKTNDRWCHNMEKNQHYFSHITNIIHLLEMVSPSVVISKKLMTHNRHKQNNGHTLEIACWFYWLTES